MNYNLLGYAVFVVIIVLIIKVVGRICFKNGNIFIAQLIPKHLELGQQINQSLLVGYYLVNIGYAAMTIVDWQPIQTFPKLVEVIAWKTSIIVFILSFLHYLNIILLTTSIRKLIKTP